MDLSRHFHSRANQIPFLGLGLSVDVYSPNLLELSAALNSHHLSVGYFEIFQAHPDALRAIRTRLPGVSMAYHAEGLWFTQPGWLRSGQANFRLKQVCQDLSLLDARWVNQECATKEIGGSIFGTYVPPLFTNDSARLTAQQLCEAQARLDGGAWGKQGSPLLLLEVPPLTYFGVGDLSYAEFFSRVADFAPCGFVLDIGHVWTAYRYTGTCRTHSFDEFIDSFLDEFPLDRVIQIHVAGLACHPCISIELSKSFGDGPSPLVDFHSAPIPQELFLALEKILHDVRLRHLKGVALEVDNKDISLICRELKFVRGQFGEVLERIRLRHLNEGSLGKDEGYFDVDGRDTDFSNSLHETLTRQYADYVSVLTGKTQKTFKRGLSISNESEWGAQIYVDQYLPQEILRWGGDLSEMFPRSGEALKRQGVELERFVKFWFETPCSGQPMAFDFFLMKIHRFVEFVHAVLPGEATMVDQEANILREGYYLSCQEVTV